MVMFSARRLSRVKWDFVENVERFTLESYAGYITVDEAYDSNLFFWFFPAKNNVSTAPVLLWLNGGPGLTSMIGAMIENGPLKVDTNGNVVESEVSWTESFSMLYVDNPVEVGYSFTRNPEGMARTSEDVVTNLYSLLTQFFTMFPDYAVNDLYIGGQSYAGQYIPPLGKYIHDRNNDSSAPSLFLNLKGVYLGGGFCNGEAVYQGMYETLYYTGMISDHSRRMFLAELENVIADTTSSGELDMANVYRLKSASNKVNEYWEMNNMLGPEYSIIPLWIGLKQFMSSNRTRSTLNVGLASGTSRPLVVSMNAWTQLIPLTLFKNSNEENAFLMDHYKVLHYTGNLDLLVSVASTEKFLRQLQWSGADSYRDSIRNTWLSELRNQLGWYTQIGNFTRVVVLNAGHQVPVDQPDAAYLMMKNFVFYQPFSA